MLHTTLSAAFAATCLLAASALALTPGPSDIHIRVLDVGGGHCAVIRIPNPDDSDAPFFIVYDAGNYSSQEDQFERFQALIPEEHEIDMLVLSHSDSDHLGLVDEVLDAYWVKQVLRGGMSRATQTWRNADEAIGTAERDWGTRVVNLMTDEFPPGATYRLGRALVTMVSGFGEPPEDWDLRGRSEKRNAGSLVIRLYYEGHAVLFTGDIVGRHIGDPASSCIAAEKFMVDNVPATPIESDVLIAPHHGADNGSATCFIEAVDPTWVIFAAGHKHEHPRKTTAERYLDHGIPKAKMLRTDRGDDEGDKEWDHRRTAGAVDKLGDDAIDILLLGSGAAPQVAYVSGS